MVNGSEQPELNVQIGESMFVVRRDDSVLRVGTKTGDQVLWQDETVPLEALPPQARTALEAGDTQSSALHLAMQGVVDAFVQRGG